MKTLNLKELSLFSGAGGGLLGTKLLGWTCLGYVEFNDYCQRVLKQRILDGYLDKAPIFGDIRTFISEGYAESYKGMVDVITAGFPCQSFSVQNSKATNRGQTENGEIDDRNKWPETLECIRRIRPRYALLENVPGLITSGYFGRIQGDLAEIGYNDKWDCFAASQLGAQHIRERVFFFADSTSKRSIHSAANQRINTPLLHKQASTHIKISLPASDEWLQLGRDNESLRTNDGVAHRVDRIKAIGNGQVPAVVEAAWKTLVQAV